MPGQQPFNYMQPGGVPPTALVAQQYQGVSSGAPAVVKQVHTLAKLHELRNLLQSDYIARLGDTNRCGDPK
jgi:hypothetical protein